MKRILSIIAAAVAVAACAPKEEFYTYHVTFPEDATLDQKVEMAAHLVPTPQQLAWQQGELTAFVHFTVNTFTDKEWGDGTEPETVFNPTELDTDQWCEALSAAGFKMVILTAKHHDGFCLWQTKTTEHCVRNSEWMDGKGDVVAMLRKSCDKYGLGMGIYLSPWDRNAQCYGEGDAYNDFFCAQLTELLTNYGKVDEVWFDGACGEGPNGKKQVYDWVRIMSLIRELQPDAVTAIQGDDIRWVGNESGLGRIAEWSCIPMAPSSAHQKQVREFEAGESTFDPSASDLHATPQDLGSRNVLQYARELWWRPAEVDVSIRPGWFYHETQDSEVKSLEHLQSIYFSSVGMNAVLLLNIPPDRRGLFHEEDVQRLKEFGEWKDATFGTPVGEGEPFDIIVLQENIMRGQRVEKFHIEVSDNGTDWTTVADGQTIGYKRILRLPEPVKAAHVRYVIDETRAEADILEFKLYKNK